MTAGRGQNENMHERIFAEKLAIFIGEMEDNIDADFFRGLELCQSPLEKVLLARLIFEGFGYLDPPHPVITSKEQISSCPKWARLAICPQFKVDKYSLDFGLLFRDFMDKTIKVAVECDGHDFHEKTKAQAAHDKRRDRRLQSAGWYVLRFTGSEVYRDSEACVEEIVDLIVPLLERSDFLAAAERRKQAGAEAHG